MNTYDFVGRQNAELHSFHRAQWRFGNCSWHFVAVACAKSWNSILYNSKNAADSAPTGSTRRLGKISTNLNHVENFNFLFCILFSLLGKKKIGLRCWNRGLRELKHLFTFETCKKETQNPSYNRNTYSSIIRQIIHIIRTFYCLCSFRWISLSIKTNENNFQKEKNKFQCRRTSAASVRFRHILTLNLKMSCEKEKWLTEMYLRMKWLVGLNEAAIHWTVEEIGMQMMRALVSVYIFRAKYERAWAVANAQEHD